MRICLSFVTRKERFPNFEDVVKYVKQWERKASKDRRFKDVRIVRVEEVTNNVESTLPRSIYIVCDVTFEGEENNLKKLFYKWMGLTKRNKTYLDDKFFRSCVVSEKAKKINEIDYGQNNTRKKHYHASNKDPQYWIYASDTTGGNINYFVKVDEKGRPYLAPVKIIDNNARPDLRPFMTKDPAKIHALALDVSKRFPKYYFNIQFEEYRETILSRFNHTARPKGLGIEYDPKYKEWFGGIDDKLPPPKPFSKNDDISKDKSAPAANKYEKMDRIKLPNEERRLEREIKQVERVIDDITRSGNASGKLEKFEKKYNGLKNELNIVKKLLGSK